VTQVTGAPGPGTHDPALPETAVAGTALAETALAATAPAASVPGRRPVRLIGRSLFLLTKPRIIELLLVTTLPTMLLADRGVPSIRLIFVTLVGGALAAASANTLNCYLDRDIDAVMRRTSGRPLVARSGGHGSGQAVSTPIRPGEALAWGVLLGAAATLLLGLAANWLAAALADAAILFYVFVYTIGLKRRTASNIVIGGAAGCFPVLVGWAAVTGKVSWWAGVLFAVIFFWTPPHFWALAMKFRDDYAAANVPMLPVVATPATVARKIVIYSYLMVASTLLLIPYAGWIYGCCAAGLGAWFLAEAHRLRGRIAAGSSPAPMRLFHLSIVYLTLLFAAVAVTALLPWHRW
jgi:protoheme IX farnesyltransferase